MPTVEERLAVIEEQNVARLREDGLRRAEMDRRFTIFDVKVDNLSEKIDNLATITQRHDFKATCINGGAKVLQGAGAGSGVLLGIYIILEKLGVV